MVLVEEKKEGGGEEGLEAMVLCLGVERGEGGVSEGLSDDGGVWGCSARTEESGKGAGVAEGGNGTRLTQVHDGERGRERETCLLGQGKTRTRGKSDKAPPFSLERDTCTHTHTRKKTKAHLLGKSRLRMDSRSKALTRMHTAYNKGCVGRAWRAG